jgi:5-methylcytosine-specific restriction endonuclease McrA
MVGAIDEPDEEIRHAAGCSRLDAVMQPPGLHPAKLRQGPLPGTLHAALPRSTAGQPDPEDPQAQRSAGVMRRPWMQGTFQDREHRSVQHALCAPARWSPVGCTETPSTWSPTAAVEVAGCDRPARKLKLCGMHYQRLRNWGKAGSAESRIDEAVIAQNRMLVGSGQKACSGCKRVLPTACFYRDARSRDGVTSACKDCKNAWQKHYQQENAAAIQAYQTRYRADPAHRQLAKERTARYRTANPDRVREARAAWRAMPENQRLARERTRTWRLANPRRRSEQARRRNALKKSGVATFISLELLDGKLAYWGWRCWINGPGCTVDPEKWDHVKPLTKGGAHMLANLRPACGHCNRRKHDRWPFLANEFR